MSNYQYNKSLFHFQRLGSNVVAVGNILVGGDNPIRLQSMTNTDTNDIEATVKQTIAIIDAGGEYVRITAPGVREAEALGLIRSRLKELGYDVPLVADIHFNPKAAEVAASLIEKVRINPGNYVDRKRGEQLNYSDEEYAAELEKIRLNLRPLLTICKQHNTAIRIGVNHGSLSDRIMSRYGDTPMGMVVSLMEFIRICREENFLQLILSIKASNTRIMVQACRLLCAMMQEENLILPLHLGVTEAGDGEDGRIKSAVGIGALLFDGIGDTIRVSLTEAPEIEIPVAQKIVEHCTSQYSNIADYHIDIPYNPFEYNRRKTNEVHLLGGDRQPVVIEDIRNGEFDSQQPFPDYVLCSKYDSRIPDSVSQIVPLTTWQKDDGTMPMINFDQISEVSESFPALFIHVTASQILSAGHFQFPQNSILLLESGASFYAHRAAMFKLMQNNCFVPVVFIGQYSESNVEYLQINAAADLGALFLDGLGDGILLSNTGKISQLHQRELAYGILQASRVRYSKTEFISCPSCGRTLFDIQNTVKEIKQRTGHLKGLKIGIMGCIVNGPGEMADADYGYVGAGRGKITLYKGKQVHQSNIPAELAVDALIDLIKLHGDWLPVNN